LFNQLSCTIGEYPLLNREFPDDSSCIKVIENLLTWGEVEFDLAEDVTYSRCAHFYSLVHCGSVFMLERFSLTLSKDAMLTLLYYGGYLTMTVCYFYLMVPVLIYAIDKVNYQFKIPNLEVMTDWSRWIVGHAEFSDDILKTCVEGPVKDFTARWPNFMH
jgi:hypothetical protein